MAKQAYDAGDVTQIIYDAAGYAGISKDLEFDMSWMSEQNQAAVLQSIREVVLAASQIHRLGYELLGS